MFSKFVSELQQNWKSGITVGVVSLPLSIALSIASGAGPIPGVITGIWACLFAALFASNNYNIIGAAGALTTLLATIASVNLIGASGSVFILPFLAILVGLVILLVYVLKLDRYLTYIPSSVMYGFAAGVAILIALTQLNDALGLVGLEKHPHFIENMKETVVHLSQVSVSTLGIFIIFLTTLLVWKKYIKKVPGVIPVAILGILFGYAVKHLALPFDVITLGDRYTLDAALYQALDIHSFLAFVQSPSGIMLLVKTAVVVALVAILETLITAKLADKLTKTTSNAQIELRGLGLANIASGLFGGLPATGVFIRT